MLSKTLNRTIIAYRKGYRVNTDGQPISPTGKLRKTCKYQTKRYVIEKFNIAVEGKVVPIKVHQLCAYQKFGLWDSSRIHVRHLDGNSLNNRPENIALGTASQNMLDRPRKDRQTHAQKAGLAKRKCFYYNIQPLLEEGLTQTEIASVLGFSVSTIKRCIRKFRAERV